MEVIMTTPAIDIVELEANAFMVKFTWRRHDVQQPYVVVRVDGEDIRVLGSLLFGDGQKEYERSAIEAVRDYLDARQR
jgi:hypothetical protein